MKPLEDRIRETVQAMDDAAPTAEQLLPEDMADELGVQRTAIEVRIGTRRSARPERGPWGIVAVAAVAVVAVALPVALIQRDQPTTTANDPDPVPTPTVSTPDDGFVEPEPSGAEPSIVVEFGEENIARGSGWAPSSELTMTVEPPGDVFTTTTDDSGAFRFSLEGARDLGGPVATVTDGSRTVTFTLATHGEIHRVDPEEDLIAGGNEGDSSGPVFITIRDRGETYTTTEQTVDGMWMVVTTGDFDITGTAVVETTVIDGAARIVKTSGAIVAPSLHVIIENTVIVNGFAPGQAIDILYDGELVATSDANMAGAFDVHPAPFEPGTVVTVTGGTTTLSGEILDVTFDSIDADEGLAMGTAPDGLNLEITILLGSPGGEPVDWFTTEQRATDGTWAIRFDPPPAGLDVVHAYLFYQSGDAAIEVQPEEFRN